jgi:hypothetical protein
MDRRFLIVSIFVVGPLTAVANAYLSYRPNAARLARFRQWMREPAAHPDWKRVAGSQYGTAPFLFHLTAFPHKD